MCNCDSLPACLIDPQFPGAFTSDAGVRNFQNYFEGLPTGPFEPPLAFGSTDYRCSLCGQRWYIEVFPEEDLEPGFAFKTDELPSIQKARSTRQFLLVLGNNGFSEEPCTWAGCPNRRLEGRALCHAHL